MFIRPPAQAEAPRDERRPHFTARWPAGDDERDRARPDGVDPDRRPIGFELACRDGTRRFLPAAAAEIDETEIRVGSPLVFLSERELGWYRSRTSAG